MNVKKEVFDKCKSMIQSELDSVHRKLRSNRYEINRLSKEQRILKSQIGVLYQTLKTF
jgi:hypothetical protein